MIHNSGRAWQFWQSVDELTTVGVMRAASRSLTERWTDRLFEPIDGSSLAAFRVMFGFIMLVEVWRFWTHGWIERYYIHSNFMFKYYGFGWVEPWAGDGMYWHFALLAVLAVMIMVGLLYRLATIVFFFAFSYVFLLEQARYLNHFYLVILIAFLLMLVPAHRKCSVDALLWPKLRSDWVPNWSLWLLRAQVEVLLIFAGLVKINADWLRLEPLGMWLSRLDDWPILGPLMNADWVVASAAYGVILLHVIGAPLLLLKRTRIPVMILYFGFHLANHAMFQIGIFPWLTMAATLVFLDPGWPQQLLRWLQKIFQGAALMRSEVANG